MLEIQNRQEVNLRPMTITVNDYQRLMGLVEFASLKATMPDVTRRLIENLRVAKQLPQEEIKNNVITMNSRVKLRDVNNGIEAEVTITYPQDAEPKKRKISVFSEIGLALLGRKEKDIVTWRVPTGMGTFEVLKVTYQPEAAGDFYL